MLRAEDIVEMAKDAERYRWLRDNWAATICRACYGQDIYGDAHMDEIVDAEMRTQQE